MYSEPNGLDSITTSNLYYTGIMSSVMALDGSPRVIPMGPN